MTDSKAEPQQTSRSQLRSGVRLKILVPLIFVSGTFLLTVVVDRFVGRLSGKPAEPAELIFPPMSALTYETPELSFTADINRLGFRDREFTTTKGAKIRALAIGDSITFGWGVGIDQSWPKVLEENLRRRGFDIEIANLGQPGASPILYAQTAAKAIPLLKPDVVIIGITQGDDLAQMKQAVATTAGAENPHTQTRQITNNPQSDGESIVLRIGGRLYPNFLFLLRKRAVSRQFVSAQWKSQAEQVLRDLKPEERSRFERLDGQVREYFMKGELNPALLQGSLTRPDYFSETFDVNNPGVRVMIRAMTRTLASIKERASGSGAEVIVVSIPYKVYASRRDLDSSRRLGLTLLPEMATSNAASEAIASACEGAGVRFFDVTAGFRAKANESPLFFELDGHLNPKGHEAFAGLLTPMLGGYLARSGEIEP